VPLLHMNIPIAEPPIPTVKERMRAIALQWPNEDDNGNVERAAAVKNALQDHFRDLRKEWDNLYNRRKHFALRDAIMDQLVMNEVNNK
jgi:chemotaxis regulatin CheY-phosphate phosphatase CheZ